MSERVASHPAGIPATHIMRRCESCNGEVWRRPSAFSGNHVWCSRQCRYRDATITLTCERCGREFQCKKSDVRKTAYCSRACRHPERIRISAVPDANVRTAKCPPWPEVKLPEDAVTHDPRPVIRAYLRAALEKRRAS